MFTQNKKDYSENTQQFLTPGKGWAVKALKDFKEGDFVIEYCGEIINNAEMQYRANRKTEEDPLYILEIDKHTFIDAEFCGNISRLINHSCKFVKNVWVTEIFDLTLLNYFISISRQGVTYCLYL